MLTDRSDEPSWQPFRCDVVPDRAVVRVEPSGELDLATVEQVRGHILELLDAGFATVHLDLGRLTFLDSSGLRMILEARMHAAGLGSRLSVHPGPPGVQRAFELAGMTELVFDRLN